MDDGVQKQYQYMCQEGDNNLYCYYHNDYIYELDPTDAGAVNNIRFWFVVYLDGWLWEYDNIKLWIS